MKNIKKIMAVLVAAFVIAGCSRNETGSSSRTESKPRRQTVSEEQHVSVQINHSDDRHIQYIKDYVGKNCASFGYYSLGGDRMERLGKGYIEFVFVTADGTYVDIEDDEVLKQYMVVSQNYEPNTEVNFTFELDSEGNEYENLVDWQSIKEIVLQVKKVGEPSEFTGSLTKINTRNNKYTAYVPDFTGRNLRSCGYVSLGGEYRAYLGEGNIILVIVTDDGSYVDIDDDEALKNYMVTGQSVAPNTEVSVTYMKNSEGVEYSNLIDWMSVEQIDLYVKKIKEGNPVTVTKQETVVEEKQESEPVKNDGIRPEFKEMVDGYEEFFDSYVEFMKKFTGSTNTASMMTEYMKFMTEYEEVMEKLEEVEDMDMNEAESSYYAEAMMRITNKLISAM